MKQKTWKKYPAYQLEIGSNCFYQKLISTIKDEEIYANIIEWTLDNKKSWTLKIQIPEEVSIIGMTINADGFSYKKLDFSFIEKDARKIINLLTKSNKGESQKQK